MQGSTCVPKMHKLVWKNMKVVSGGRLVFQPIKWIFYSQPMYVETTFENDLLSFSIPSSLNIHVRHEFRRNIQFFSILLISRRCSTIPICSLLWSFRGKWWKRVHFADGEMTYNIATEIGCRVVNWMQGPVCTDMNRCIFINFADVLVDNREPHFRVMAEKALPRYSHVPRNKIKHVFCF